MEFVPFGTIIVAHLLCKAKIWLLAHLILSVFLVASPSPFMGVVFLVIRSVFLAAGIGRALTSWIFFSVVIVYVGGVLVLFVYMSSLVTRHKIQEISPPWRQVLAGVRLVWLFKLQSEDILSKSPYFLRQGLSPSSQGITLFRVVYLILTLVVVLGLLGKDGGPIKASC